MGRQALKIAAALFFFMLVSETARGHVVAGELEKMSAAQTAVLYLKLGYEHILPLGFDHVLFILSLFLLSPSLKLLIWQSTAFTVAHSITLGMAMYNVIAPPPAIIEPLISLSIAFIAVQNILVRKVKATRIGMIFLFGLIHGLGFASALSDLGLPQTNFLTSLAMFNVGVELGQLSVILLAFFLVGKWFGKKPFYRKAIVIPASLVIVLVAGYWTIQRIFLL